MNTASMSSRMFGSWSPPPAFEPLETISSYPSHLVRWRECADARFKLSSYVFIGQRTSNTPVKMAFVAGLRSRDSLAIQAVAKLLVELEVAPLVAADYALFSYAVTGESNLDRDFGCSIFQETPPNDEAIARIVETDLERNDVDGVISVATNESVNGFQFETDSELIATEIAWPALEVAGRFVPLADEPVKVLSDGVLGSLRGGERGIPRQMFGLAVRTPATSGPGDQVAAIVFSSIRILQQYRKLLRSALDL